MSIINSCEDITATNVECMAENSEVSPQLEIRHFNPPAFAIGHLLLLQEHTLHHHVSHVPTLSLALFCGQGNYTVYGVECHMRNSVTSPIMRCMLGYMDD